jgi:D-alanyl-lipoteichoic acid acyltransferase DltB (MBOAT superfamily)
MQARRMYCFSATAAWRRRSYADFVYRTINDVFGANLILLHIILPLGISFITFQKIAFLIDVQAGR